MSQHALNRLRERMGLHVLDAQSYRGDESALLERGALREACFWLRDDASLDFAMLTDLTAVDYLEQRRAPRFELVYQLYSLSTRHRLRLKVALDDPDSGVDSVSDIWRNANWLEREVWDLYGIRFRNHPDLRRILLYEPFDGHPLRKDYPKEQRQPLVRRPAAEIEQVIQRRQAQHSLLTGPGPNPSRSANEGLGAARSGQGPTGKEQ